MFATRTPTMTATPLLLILSGNQPKPADGQRIAVEGILAYPNSIEGLDLGSPGMRYGLYLKNPVNGETIRIWFETSPVKEMLPNRMKPLPYPFRHDDITVYDYLSQSVYPGDWIWVEGVSNNSNLIVEKVVLLRSYPPILHTDDIVHQGDEIFLIDTYWVSEGVLVFVFESPNEFLGEFRLDAAGNDFACKDFNDYRLFCSGQGITPGNEAVVNLIHLISDREELMLSDTVWIP